MMKDTTLETLEVWFTFFMV